MRGLLEKDIRLLMHSKQTFVCFIALAVVLGVCVTILLYRLRKAEEHRKKAEEYKQSQQLR